jgi:hypothetical protein
MDSLKICLRTLFNGFRYIGWWLGFEDVSRDAEIALKTLIEDPQRLDILGSLPDSTKGLVMFKAGEFRRNRAIEQQSWYDLDQSIQSFE